MKLYSRNFKLLVTLVLTIVLVGLLTACGDATATTAPAVTTTAAVATTAASAATTAATGATTAPAGAATTAAAGAGAGIPAFGDKPVNITVVDVAGNLAYTKAIWENYKKANPNRVGNIDYQITTAPELPAKIKAQQDAGKVDIALVLSGFDAMAAGVEQNLWVKLMPDYSAKFPNLEQNYIDAAKRTTELAKGFGIVNVYSPSGPLVTYNPDTVKNPPKTAEELKTWVKDHPNKFFYARPANSGPGRTILMGLPYILGDKDPTDPDKGWDKTWAYLQELDKSIEYYTPGTSVLMKEFGQGGRDMTVTTVGWDTQMRANQTVPNTYKVGFLQDFVWIADSHFMLIPKGLDKDRLAVVLDMMAFSLKPEQQAYTYNTGGFYPGPAVKGVTLDQAPKEVKDTIKDYIRTEYDKPFADVKVVMPLDTKQLVAAFDKWDKLIGAKVKK